MAKKKYDLITELYLEAVKEATATPENWMAFLNSACRNYRLPFDEQLLIHAQRPNATAVLQMEDWNKKFGRWVKRDTRGIAVIDRSATPMRLKYYFDISDTKEGQYRRLVNPVPLWEVKEPYREDVRVALKNAFRVSEEITGFTETILEAAQNAAGDSLKDYLGDILESRKGSSLEGLDGHSIEEQVKKLLTNSIAYMVMRRCGIDTETSLDTEKFQDITNINTPELVNLLGTAVSAVAEMALGELSAAVQELQKEENQRNRTFAGEKADRYNKGRKTENTILERSLDYERNPIQETGRLLSSRPYHAGRTGNTPWEVRVTSPELSGKIPLRDIHKPADTGEAEPASEKDAGRGTGQDGAGYDRDGEGTGRDREVEGGRPDAVAPEDVQHPAGSGRNRDEGAGIQLKNKEKLLPTVEEQHNLMKESAEGKNSAFSLSQEVIDAVIKADAYEELGKYHIYAYFQKSHTDQEKAEFLKKEYGVTASYAVIAGSRIHMVTNAEGIKLRQGDIGYLLRWEQAAKRINELIAARHYMTEKELEYLPEYEKAVLTARIYHFYQRHPEEMKSLHFQDSENHTEAESIRAWLDKPEQVEKLLSSMAEILKQATESGRHKKSMQRAYQDLIDYRDGKYSLFSPEPVTAELPPETIVYIGMEKYEIQSITETRVVLQDHTYPLFTKEMSREEFDRKVWENPANSLPNAEKVEKQLSSDLTQGQKQQSQYRITNDELGYGTPKEKFRANIMAIQLLKKCETENRYATPEEQEILSGYAGWGGLADAFDETKSAWGYEYLELKTVLTPEEYAAARQSTLTAFYTPPTVIRAIYQALENMGLKTGNILEPSCGTGNFIGMKPESLSDCRIYGIEIDSISGRIAGQLYQKSTIAIQGYEKADLPDSFFDAAIGNVPFGQYKLSDKRYDKNNFQVHDYFFAKTLDKVRPGGVIAFITSAGTMDKKNPAIRKYMAQRAELLGAIRLPDDTFKKNAGTEVTADILFLQKRDRMAETAPDWLHLDTGENGITQNHYFTEHPEMVLGEMALKSTQYGMASTCRPYKDASLENLLAQAVKNIQAEITDYKMDGFVEEADNSIPADPSVANFSFVVYDGKIHYRENSRMKPVELSETAANRVKSMISIRDCVRELIAYQAEGYADTDIEKQQKKLNHIYDAFQKKYGLLNNRANSIAFSDDSSYPLLCSLEIVEEDGKHARKADMFTRRTIRPHQTVTKVNTSSEALALSLSEKARVDMDYMSSLTGKKAEEIEQELTGVIFRLPDVAGEEPQYVSEDAYLSGNVREKLKAAQIAAQTSEIYKSNVEALEKVQPKDLPASEISVRLGATWIPASDVSEFVFWLLDTPSYNRWNIKIHFCKLTGEWNIEGKNIDKGNPKANNVYGTHRANAYKIIEDTLNLRDIRVYDYIETEGNKKKGVLNRKETAIAQGKQDIIKQAFQDWIWKNPERRQRLTAYYNEHFNAVRPREYDGSHLNFYGMNPEIKLRQHQKNGVARILYGGNSLLAYVVGAGKTYTMAAAAMESRRLGLCNKSMVVVPNHIIEQFAAEWMQLYPAASLLVATRKDFETRNRKKFCARIATSDIDAVIIGHSQFEKIPLSTERQQRMLEAQIEEVIEGIAEVKKDGGSRFTIKQMEKTKKTLEAKQAKLHDQSRKDDVISFEELGIDRLFVDEADGYKNLYLYTKMRNVGGIAQTEAQKSSDMFLKCRYLDEITGGKGVIFATGTPISNTMAELYTIQRYLQYNTLVKNHLQHFDAWASTFGETVSAIELAPEGSGYRMKTRFAKFYNLPELMLMFREVADIQTADMLDLPVPEAEYRVVKVKPGEIQKDMVQKLGERAERVRNGIVNPMQDNMLLITNDGRKLALDQRLTNEMLPDEPESKVNACVKEVYRYWEEGKEQKLTQLLFCDLSTPKEDGTFSVYNDVRDKLIAKGIPPEEIAFIHDAGTEVKKKELYTKVRKGAVRILMGSTFKMGAGTNVQDLIIASHDLDCPWRPRDVGRILRTFK